MHVTANTPILLVFKRAELKGGKYSLVTHINREANFSYPDGKPLWVVDFTLYRVCFKRDICIYRLCICADVFARGRPQVFARGS